MLKQLDGSVAVGDAVALCRPEVISCYPITPQTHILEHLGELVKSGELPGCEYLNLDSEFSAMSCCIGASAAGARTYTATASQGLLYMMEAVYNAAGLGLPIVMTLGNRAIGAPINIWNDHSDALAAGNSGWLQLFVENNQEAVDVHIQAFRIAEALSQPVMVCMDGFVLTHAYSRVDMPEQEQVDRFLPTFEPRQVLDPAAPISIGAMVGPEAFTEVQYLAHIKQLDALKLIPQVAREFQDIFGRDSGGLIKTHGPEDAETIVVCKGSIIGTMKEVMAGMREDGISISAVTIRSSRPFPKDALREALKNAKRVLVFDKSLAVGFGSMLASNVRWTMTGLETPINAIIGGLGGRPITRKSLRRVFEQGIRSELEETHFLDLQHDIIARELDRERKQRRSGPMAENIVRSLGAARAASTG